MPLVPIDDKYLQVIPILLEVVEFKKSPEFEQLKGIADDLPGVVACTYARYIGRILMASPSKDLARNLTAPLNQFAFWNDPKINEMLRDEVFEQIEEDGSYEALARFINDDLAHLFDDWRASSR